MTAIDRVIDEALNDDATGGLLPYESWEKLKGETAGAFAAFRAYRDFGPERNVRKAVDSIENDETMRAKRYRVWRKWAVDYRWRERAGDFDRYTEKLRLAEMRKTIEAQGERHRQVTGKMLDVVSRKLDLMDPADLTQGNVTDWVEAAIKAERDAAGLVTPNGGGQKQGELIFTPDFQGL